MKNSRIFRGTFAILFFITLFALAGFAVMYLWNLLIPSVIGWTAINYWQALGFMVLSRLLFGGFGHFRYHPGSFFFGNRDNHAQFHEGMRNMSWEERREHIRRHMTDFRDGRFDKQASPTDNNGR